MPERNAEMPFVKCTAGTPKRRSAGAQPGPEALGVVAQDRWAHACTRGGALGPVVLLHVHVVHHAAADAVLIGLFSVLGLSAFFGTRYVKEHGLPELKMPTLPKLANPVVGAANKDKK